MTKTYRQRIRKLQKILAERNPGSAIVISSSPSALRSNDTTYPYSPNPDLFYLTGSSEIETSLVVFADSSKKPVLITTPIDPHYTVWEGKREPAAKRAKLVAAELKVSKSPLTEIKSLLRGIEQVYLQSLPNTLSWKIGVELQSQSAAERRTYPHTISMSDEVMAELRLYKDADEVNAIVRAGIVTGQAIYHALPLIQAGTVEEEIAAAIDHVFASVGARPAFNSIVAGGPSAAVLHYFKLTRKLKRGEMVLMDIGAQLDMYCADITRVLPVDGLFSNAQADVYSIVLEAQQASITAAKHGSPWTRVHAAAVKVITEGLVDLGVLKGKVSKLIDQGAYKTWFPHGIGHSLGIDVHDITTPRSLSKLTLKKGMVFTIEPGLYFAKALKGIPSCGIRIEDDILITEKAPKVLTENAFPKSLEDLVGL